MPSLLEPDRAVCSSVEVSEEGPFFYESVKLALNGVEYGEPQFLRFYDQPSLFLEILPVTGGPVAGGTLITLGGYGFRNFDDGDTALGKVTVRGRARVRVRVRVRVSPNPDPNPNPD